jgi:hypothetical protein
MIGNRFPADAAPRMRDLLIGALVAAALIAAPSHTVDRHLMAGVSHFAMPSRTGDAPAKACNGRSSPCNTQKPPR